jgi:hypothetical protein
MTYRLPAGVQVGPYFYRFRRTRIADSNKRWAETDHLMREIRFGELATANQLPLTLMHELVHAVESAYGMEFNEDDVTRIANGLSQALTSLGLLPEEMEL